MQKSTLFFQNNAPTEFLCIDIDTEISKDGDI